MELIIQILAFILISIFINLIFLQYHISKHKKQGIAEGIITGVRRQTDVTNQLKIEAVSKGYAEWSMLDSKQGVICFRWKTPQQ